MNIEIPELSNANDVLNTVQDVGSTAMSYVGTDLLQIIVGIAVIYFALRFLSRMCNVTRSVSKMTEIERRGGKRWDKPKKAEKSRDCGGGKF